MDVFSYIDYRKFLLDFYEDQKKENKFFSFRYFARMAGLGSSGYMKMVIKGDRNLSPSSINKFVKALKLKKREAVYFENLVFFNQAKDDKERDLYFERLKSLKPQTKITGLEKDQYAYYTKHYYVIIREMVALPHFVEDPQWIAKHVKPNIKPIEAKETIEALLRLKLLKRIKGKLVQNDTSLTTLPEIENIDVFNFQRQMLNQAKEAMINETPECRDITSVTIPIPANKITAVKKRIQNFQEKLMDFINKGDQDYYEVFQLNTQLFTVTNTNDGEEKS